MGNIISFENWRRCNLCGIYEVWYQGGKGKELKITATSFEEVFINEYNNRGGFCEIIQGYPLGTSVKEIYNDFPQIKEWWKEIR